jgi:glycosyltransferase involved in cell wall biosynthesis
MRVLFVSYPLLPVNDESCGGAEQVLVTLEREMAHRGHSTVIAGCVGTRAAGAVFETGAVPDSPDQVTAREHEQNDAIVRLTKWRQFDILHDHGGNMWRRASELNVPVLATLHLPRTMYAEDLFSHVAPNVFFNCVSESQMAMLRDVPQMIGCAENGIELDRFWIGGQRRDYVLWLGRICEEKGPHLAIAAAREAQMPLVIAGDVYPLSYHQAFFEREVKPAIDGRTVRFVPCPSSGNKLRLLQQARAVLLPSLVEETSSLVAMEAMACGTPVIAFARGAFFSIVSDQETGYIVDDVGMMAKAISWCEKIDPQASRRRVGQRFSARRMADRYENLYREILTAEHSAAA